MFKGLGIMVVVLLVVLVVFLAFQVNDNSLRCREAKATDQERLTRASKLSIMSAAQNHPLFAHEHAQEAKYLLDEVVQRAGGVAAAERDLKVSHGTLERLKHQVYERFQDAQGQMLEYVTAVHPQLDIPENESAGLTRPKKKQQQHKKSSKH